MALVAVRRTAAGSGGGSPLHSKQHSSRPQFVGSHILNCFVIMPFSPEFDDVYTCIKTVVESVTREPRTRCFRLDESRPAGRITDRLLKELRSASLCIADLSGTRPNVMWEVGYAMALDIPVVVITQDHSTLPFDLKDMQHTEYNRSRLNATLGSPLLRSVIDTLDNHHRAGEPKQAATSANSDDLIGSLIAEVSQLKAMITSVVHAWNPSSPAPVQPSADLANLEGHWFGVENESNFYARIFGEDLVAPYCFGGNHTLTGVYHGWRRVGEFWYGRFHWVDSEIAGFSFLRRDSPDALSGAWWYEEDEVPGTTTPPKHAGVQSTWIRKPDGQLPTWASECFAAIQQHGLAAFLQLRMRAGKG